MTANLVHESVTHYLESARNYMKFICDGLISCSASKSDLVKGLPSFDYRILFELPEGRSALCYGCLFKGFSVPGGVARELRTVYVEKDMDLVDGLR